MDGWDWIFERTRLSFEHYALWGKRARGSQDNLPHLQFFCLHINLFDGANFLGKAEHFPYCVPELKTFHAIVITKIDIIQLKITIMKMITLLWADQL